MMQIYAKCPVDKYGEVWYTFFIIAKCDNRETEQATVHRPENCRSVQGRKMTVSFLWSLSSRSQMVFRVGSDGLLPLYGKGIVLCLLSGYFSPIRVVPREHSALVSVGFPMGMSFFLCPGHLLSQE